MKYCLDLSCEEDTLSLGKKIAQNLKSGCFFALKGELGAGKTVFVKGLALGLNIKTRVTSPTFTIMCQYSGARELYHFDLYRVTEEECYDMGFDDFFFDKNAICAVEWSEHLTYLPPKAVTISLEKTSDNSRRAIIEDEFDVLKGIL